MVPNGKGFFTANIYDNGFTIRIPVHMMETINKISSLQVKLYQKLGATIGLGLVIMLI